jgi:hypothetical protein
MKAEKQVLRIVKCCAEKITEGNQENNKIAQINSVWSVWSNHLGNKNVTKNRPPHPSGPVASGLSTQ